MKTVLSWAVEGCISPVTSVGTVLVAHDAKLERVVRDYINLDLFGLRYKESEPRSVLDEQALDIMEQTVRRVGDRFECPLLWASMTECFLTRVTWQRRDSYHWREN